MRRKPVIPRAAAHRDVEEVIDYYTDAGGKALARRFQLALRAGYATIADHPAIGSLRHSLALDIDNLRTWRLQAFPYIVFYIEREDRIEIQRVLHAHRDVLTELASDDEDDR